MTPPVSRTVDLDGPVHLVDHGGPDDGPVVVCLHGLGGSHANWHDLAPLLARTCRVLALDLAGFGRTPRVGRSASVKANRLLVDRFLREHVRRPVVLLGNSMGGTIAMLEAAASPELVEALVLIGPALPRTRSDRPAPFVARQVALCAVPALGERVLVRRRGRLGAEGLITETLALTTVDASRVSPAMRELAVELISSRAAGPDAEAAYVEAARSLGLLVARSAALRSTIASITAPGLVLQGASDRLVPPAGTRQLAALQPGWRVELLDGLGHVPQIEDPARTAELVTDFLAELPAQPRLSGPQQLAGAS
jgi:pimeloyl-ACP methyl ester carboxylesterase